MRNTLHKLKVITQEDDVEKLLEIYENGDHIVEQLFQQLTTTDEHLAVETARYNQLWPNVSVLEKGIDPEAMKQIERNQVLSRELEAHERRLANIERSVTKQRVEIDNLNVNRS